LRELEENLPRTKGRGRVRVRKYVSRCALSSRGKRGGFPPAVREGKEGWKGKESSTPKKDFEIWEKEGEGIRWGKKKNPCT